MKTVYLIFLGLLLGVFLQLWSSDGFKVEKNGVIVYGSSVITIGKTTYLFVHDLVSDEGVQEVYDELEGEVDSAVVEIEKEELEGEAKDVSNDDSYEDPYDYYE